MHFWHSLIDVVCTGDEKNRTTRATCERHEATCVRPDTASDAYSGRTPHSTSFWQVVCARFRARRVSTPFPRPKTWEGLAEPSKVSNAAIEIFQIARLIAPTRLNLNSIEVCDAPTRF